MTLLSITAAMAPRLPPESPTERRMDIYRCETVLKISREQVVT
jgi:hypothetical protein